jgi:hypothetical protein
VPTDIRPVSVAFVEAHEEAATSPAPAFFALSALATDPVPVFKLLRGDIAYAQVSAFAPGMPQELFSWEESR